jgi:hypothetical protein
MGKPVTASPVYDEGGNLTSASSIAGTLPSEALRILILEEEARSCSSSLTSALT